jgi:hypothetical protein
VLRRWMMQLGVQATGTAAAPQHAGGGPVAV